MIKCKEKMFQKFRHCILQLATKQFDKPKCLGVFYLCSKLRYRTWKRANLKCKEIIPENILTRRDKCNFTTKKAFFLLSQKCIQSRGKYVYDLSVALLTGAVARFLFPSPTCFFFVFASPAEIKQKYYHFYLSIL